MEFFLEEFASERNPNAFLLRRLKPNAERMRWRLGVRWLPVLHSSTAECGAGNWADTAFGEAHARCWMLDVGRSMLGVSPSPKRVCALTMNLPLSRPSATLSPARSGGEGRERIPRTNSRIEPLNQFVQVGRVTPCAPGFGHGRNGAHGVTRPTQRFMGRGNRSPSHRNSRDWICWRHSQTSDAQPLFLLPGGEGQDEGERHIHLHSAFA